MKKGFFIRATALTFALFMLLFATLTACGDAEPDNKLAENTTANTADEAAEVTTTGLSMKHPGRPQFRRETLTSVFYGFRQRLEHTTTWRAIRRATSSTTRSTET